MGEIYRMASKLLSIITVTKNCAHTIERTLQSVMAVKTEGVEYIVVDGVSKDGTLMILEKYSTAIDRFVSEPDSGIYNAMNKGVALAGGEYVLFINGDDELIPEGLKKTKDVLFDCAEHIVCAATVVSSDGVSPSFTFLPNPQRLIFGDSLPHPSSFIKRDLLIQNPYREDLNIASDYDFFLKMFLSGMEFKIVPYQSAVHYLGGVSSDNRKRIHEVNLVLREHLGFWRAYNYKAMNLIAKVAGKILAILR